MRTLILAKNITEANRFARAIELDRFSYRAVRNSAAIRGTRKAEVYVLSSFLQRPDRHAIIAALRFSRLDVIYADLADFPEVSERTPLNIFTDRIGDAVASSGRGSLTDRQLEAAYRYNRLRDQAQAKSDDADALTELAAPEAATERRQRRRRCADCGDLIEPEDVESHAKKHAEPQPEPSGFKF